MDYSEYRRHDAVGLAELVVTGQVSADDLLDTAIARLEQVEPTLNSVVRRLDDRARARVREGVDGPFAGVPFLIKDLGQDIAGIPTSSGSRALAQWPAEENSVIVDRWLDAGLVVFGKTNTPEFGAKGITEPEAFGPTRNPWDPTRTPGGSSGGSAAAVAAGVVPAAGASDGGGSIRIPAACCGLLGLKPGRGLVPTGPRGGEPLHGAATNGVITRTVRDAAALLDVMAGPHAAGPYPVARPERSYTDSARTAPARLRIGFAAASPIGTPVDPEAIAAVEDAAALLEELGHHVEPASTGVDERRLAEDFLAMWFATAAAEIDETRRLTGAGPDAFEFDTRIIAELGRSLSAPDYIEAHARWADYSRQLTEFHERYDLLLTPTIAGPPVRIGELATPRWMRAVGKVLLATRTAWIAGRAGFIDRLVDENLGRTPYTQLANITGRPAISVPLYWTGAGLPLGVQFVAPLGGEPTLLALAAELEQARPWFDRQPPLAPANGLPAQADQPSGLR
ncbi:amidase [Rhodococcus sp. Z13]|uniref:Amidase n=1 Tax=Rhodococcus sacchari TaxID=2962047 RepID=A0ACD4DLX9_9NOCA|nr:amidase [Rhodococcus sp. Z13]UYP21047.1 amidase [Rhodococcus sp. Z13]